jgi:replicative DNA helicase
MTESRVSPQHLEAEKGLLGILMYRPEWVYEANLDVSDFYLLFHRKVYARFLKLAGEGAPVDLVTMCGSNQQAVMTLTDYMANVVPSIAKLKYYAGIVREMAQRRKIIQECLRLVNAAHDLDTEFEGISKGVASLMDCLAQSGHSRGNTETLKESLKGTMEHMDSLATVNKGFPTQWRSLNAMIGGLHRGDLLIVGGRPSQGKTSFVMNLAEYLALDSEPPVCVLIFSLEMSREQLLMNTIARRAGVEPWRVRAGNLRDTDVGALQKQAERLQHVESLIVDNSANLNAQELKAKARAAHARYGVDVAIVDYLQLMEHPRERGENTSTAIGRTTRELKVLAHDLNIVCIVLSQLSREPTKRDGARPRMSDLRESGSIEQDADGVFLIHRPEYYKENDRPGVAEIIIEKQRVGPTGTVELRWNKSLMEFSEPGSGGQRQERMAYQ